MASFLSVADFFFRFERHVTDVLDGRDQRYCKGELRFGRFLFRLSDRELILKERVFFRMIKMMPFIRARRFSFLEIRGLSKLKDDL